MKRSMARCSVGILCLLPLAQAGCFSSHAASDAGIRIGDPTLAQFKAGVTTEHWLIAVLGKPSSSAVVEGVEDTRVLRYATAERTTGLSALFSGSSVRNTSVTYFIVTGGVVTRFWADRAKETSILGKPVEAESGAKQTGPSGD
jgi:hypothetical protein